MHVRRALGIAAIVLSWVAVPALGQDDDDGDAADLRLRWSLTPIAEYRWIEPGEEDDDGITGWFDQYEFVPNKSSAFPVEIGVRDAALDALGEGDTPHLQLRLESPTSNLGVSGEQVDEPFFNQRALALGRLPGLDLDLRYWRLRTEEVRLFPNTAATGIVFEDRSSANDRFARERTGFAGELRARPAALSVAAARIGELAAPELSLHGGYEVRDGQRQRRFLIDPSNRWIGLAQDREQEVADVGGGLLVAPGGWFTLDLDVDHERFRENEGAILQSALGGGIAPNASTIGFVPDTDRTTGTARLRGRIGDRAVLEGGFQASFLEQTGDRTPLQSAAGLRDNELLFYSGRIAADVAILDALSANAWLRYDRRDNDIERGTALFGPANGTQVDPFVESWSRLDAGLELVWRLNAANRVALGGRYASVDRDLDFASPGCPPLPCAQAILPVNALVHDDSESWTVYGRTQLRPLRRVAVSGELGYRAAPETGYVTELDDYVYGKLRASYTPPLPRSLVLSLVANGGHGENRNQEMVGGGGLGVAPSGPSLRRRFERTNWSVGLSANALPWEDVGVFASLFVSSDAQDIDLALSSLQRYLQPLSPVTFVRAGATDYESEQWSVVIGTHVDLDEQTDASLAYTFTRAETTYRANGSPQLALVRSTAEIDSDLHGVDLELGRWLRDGLRVLVGYRFEYFADDTGRSESLGSAVRPFDPTTMRHTVTLGITLTSALLEEH